MKIVKDLSLLSFLLFSLSVAAFAQNKNPCIVVPAVGYNLEPKYIERVQKFMSTVPVIVKPSAVILIDPNKFHDAASAMGVHDTNIAFSVNGRIYLNGDVFTTGRPRQLAKELQYPIAKGLPELALPHELAHLNSKIPISQQERQDSRFNEEGRQIFLDWIKAKKQVSPGEISKSGNLGR